MKKWTSVITLSAALLWAGASLAAKPVKSHQGTPGVAPKGTSATLVDQTAGNTGNGISSQNFEAAYDGYDNQAADDFTVPSGHQWTIDTVTAVGSFSAAGPVASVNVTFYNNSGTLPGAAIPACTYTAISGGAGPNLTMTLAPTCVLTAGTYWVSVQANMDFAVGGQWYFTTQPTLTGNPAAWQNPGNAFATGCTTWGVMTTCLTGQTQPDMAFTLLGTDTTVPVELQKLRIE